MFFTILLELLTEQLHISAGVLSIHCFVIDLFGRKSKCTCARSPQHLNFGN